MKKILVTEDNNDLLTALIFVVTEQGYDVTGCSTEKEFYTALGADEYDLAILDVFLSGGDGREILKNVRNDAKYDDLPILMISAIPSMKKIVMENGANDFLAKPFNVSELIEKIETLIS